jgi:predicted enzyme related to lactoylglutathione lyase
MGARLALWQAGTHFGAERVNDVGCLCMNELVTTDLDGARAFYERLFGWTTGLVDTGPGGPTLVWVRNDESLNAHMSAEPGPPHWRPYFTVESTATTVTNLEALGGSVVAGPFPIPNGSIAVARDPQGAEFALFEGETDP